MQVVLVYLQPFRRNSLLKCTLQPKIAKNSLKPPTLGVQGHILLTFVDISKKLVASVSSMSVPICNHFHVR